MRSDVQFFEGIAPSRVPLDEEETRTALKALSVLEAAGDETEVVLPTRKVGGVGRRCETRSLVLGRTRIDVVSWIEPPADEGEARAWILAVARAVLDAPISQDVPIGASAEAVMVAEDLYAEIEGTQDAPNPTTGTSLTHACALGPSRIAIHCVGLIVAAAKTVGTDVVPAAPIGIATTSEDLFGRACTHLSIHTTRQNLGPLWLDPMERMRATLARKRSR